MRVLMLPRIEATWGVASITIIPLELVKTGLRSDPTAYFYVCVHEDIAKEKSWLLNYGLTEDEIERVELVPLNPDIVGSLDVLTYSRRLEYSMGAALSERRHRRLFDFLDVVVTECFPSVPMIKAVAGGTYSHAFTCDVPVVSYAHWNPTSNWPVPFNGFDHVASETGLLYSDRIILGSTKVREDYERDYRKNLSPSAMKKLFAKSSVIPIGCDVSKIPFRDTVEGDGPVIMWSGYITQDYRDCAPAMIKALLAGVVKKVIFQCLDFQHLKETPEDFLQYDRMENVELLPLMPHDEYVKRLVDADIGIQLLSSKYFTYSIRTLEMFAAGQVMLTTKPLAKNLLWEGYPFVGTAGSAFDMILRACALLGEVKGQKFRRKLRRWAEDQHSSVDGMKKVWSVVQSVAQEAVDCLPGGEMQDRLQSFLDGRDRVVHHEVESHVKTYMGMFSRNFIRWCIFKCGWRDIGNKGEPVYERIKHGD